MITTVNGEDINTWFDELQESNNGELLEYGEEFRCAIVGVVTRCSFEEVICYDYDRCIDVLMKRGMDYEEAIEYFSYNIEGAYVGPRTPMILRAVSMGEDKSGIVEVLGERGCKHDKQGM